MKNGTNIYTNDVSFLLIFFYAKYVQFIYLLDLCNYHDVILHSIM
jgi:hypothetical protein